MKFNRKVLNIGILVLAGLSAGIALYSYFILGPTANDLADDFSYSASLESSDNMFDLKRNQYGGVQTSRGAFEYSTESTDGNVSVIKSTFDVTTLSGEPIINIERNYAIDRTVKAHVQKEGIDKRGGYLFAPTNIKSGQNYSYWHLNYDQEVEMIYQSTESILGVETYRYAASFTADQTSELSNLDGVPDKYGISVDVELTTWVEPVTGRLINYTDKAQANYYDAATKRVVAPWNKFSNKFTQPSIESQVFSALEKKEAIRFFSFVLPLSLFVFGLILLGIRWTDYKLISNKLPIIIFVVGVVITLLIAMGTRRNVQFERQANFDKKISALEGSIEGRLKFYNDTLYTTQGFIQASDNVSKQEWETFTDDINLPNRLPGILGVGYSLKVGEANLVPAFEDAYRTSLNYSDFDVHPLTTSGDSHAVIYFEPLTSRNIKTIGYNMFSEPTMRAAMEMAAKTGSTSISGPIELAHQHTTEVQKGFLMYLPQYLDTISGNPEKERSQLLAGFVYSPFRAGDFMKSVINENGSDLAFRVYSQGVTPENIIFENLLSKDMTQPSRESTIDLFGTIWTIHYFDKPTLLAGINDASTNSIVGAGLALTILSTIVAVQLAGAGKWAKKLEYLNAERKKLSGTILQDEALFSGIGDGLVATDQAGKIVLANPAFERLLGWKTEEVLGKDLAEVLNLYDESGVESDLAEEIIKSNLAGKNDSDVSTLTDIYFKRKDGGMLPVSINLSPVILKKRIVGVVEVFRDVTLEKQIDRAKSEFISLASHQLRTPLTAINWYTDMLKAGDAGELNEEQSKYIAEVRGGSERMVALVDAFLNVSRIDLGTFMIEPLETDLVKLCSKIVQDSEPRIFERKQSFEENYPKNMTKLKIDAPLMVMVIDNLVSNAIKYTPEKGTIKLSIKQWGDNFRIDVTDTGYGIPQAQQDKIFSKLFRADNVLAHDTEGTGLGLYIAKSVIEAAGGEISFMSKENVGTTFSVIIPKTGMVAHSGSRRLGT
jgi:PAS domain S-box-containing protein